ncbi:MAG: dihydroxyacetone kinase transcriptional activator DhaS [Clostridiales bacterium]
MSDSYITKKALADSLKHLMKTIPLSKIAIRNIVENCKLNRQTFYYHFKDKYDLVNWIYYNEVILSIHNYKNYENWIDGLFKVLQHLDNNKSFYVNAINTSGQNSFNSYLFEITYNLIYGVIDELSNNCAIKESEKIFISEFYSNAFVGITIQWIKSGMKEPYAELTEKIKITVDGAFSNAINHFISSK